EDGIRDFHVTGVQTCALPIYAHREEDGAGAAGAEGDGQGGQPGRGGIRHGVAPGPGQRRQAWMAVVRMARAPMSYRSSMMRWASLEGTMARTATQPSLCSGETVGDSSPGVRAT